MADVVRADEVESALHVGNVSDLKNFHVVAQYVTGHLERSHVDHLHVWVSDRKDAAEL